jgi:hypothetical protein
MQVLLQKIILEHNHSLERCPSITKQMSEHKMKEVAVDDMINITHKARVNHVKLMHALHNR